MFSWRVTKYDPQYRDGIGAYTVDDWTGISQVGSEYYDVRSNKPAMLTMENYLEIENTYVNCALHFLGENLLTSLKIVELENHQIATNGWKNNLHGLRELCQDFGWLTKLKNFQEAGENEISILCRLNLRETLWCKLESEDRFFIHFGYDYYMYIGSSYPCVESISYALSQGLFVESYQIDDN